MAEWFVLLPNAALVNNLLLTQLIGLDLPFSGDRHIKTAWFVGLVMTYCLTLLMPSVYILNTLLIVPFQLQKLAILLYMMLIIMLVFPSQIVARRLLPLHYHQINAVAPILLGNSALLAIILLQNNTKLSLLESIGYGFFCGIGFLCLLLLVSCLRDRLNHTEIPVLLRGIPILLITLGIFCMGLGRLQ